jgi:myo-inositol-1-phosphate synthase
MRKIRIAIVGVGNCASSLVQGINFYDGSSANGTSIGLMHRQIGGIVRVTLRSWLLSILTGARSAWT